MSATPGAYELERSRADRRAAHPADRRRRPADQVRPTDGQIDDLLDRIRDRVERRERVIVTTLTKKMAEDLTDYMHELGVKVQYLHSEVDTLERVQILRDLRLGVYDVLVGINLLREGIDLPEVTLVAILDADKEGFLRSAWSLIQVIGRAARNTGGEVVMYADTITESMRVAIDETDRRRAVQVSYNAAHGIEPHDDRQGDPRHQRAAAGRGRGHRGLPAGLRPPGRPPSWRRWSRVQVEKVVAQMEAEMKSAAKQLEFERAAALRDEIQTIRLRILDGDASTVIARAAEAAALTPAGRRTPEGAPPARGRRRPGAPRDVPSGMEITSVAVLPASEEPVAPPPPDVVEGDGTDTAADTASDWLPGIRDEHDEAPGWQARWLDRPTWDRTVTPNIRHRTGTRAGRRRR